MKKQMQTVGCPKSMVGRVIGKNGETIRSLQNYTGALIQIDQSTDPMKVTISGTQESVALAISMVTDIVNGTFKGFAMLRQVTNEQAKGDATVCQPVYAPGYGLIPPSHQVCPAAASAAVTDTNTKARASQQTPSMASGQFPGLLSPCLDSPSKAQLISPYLMGINGALDKLSLGMNGLPQTAAMNGAAVSNGVVNPSQIGSLDFLPSSGLSQTLTDSMSPMRASADLSVLDLGLPLSDAAAPQSLFGGGQLNMSLENLGNTAAVSSPPSGSMSPDVSTAWATNMSSQANLSSAKIGGTPSFPTDMNQNTLSNVGSDLASNIKNLSELLTTSSAGSSHSDTSDTIENPISSRLSPRSTGNNVVVITDPSGRPFAVNILTGETQWINDARANLGALHPFAAASIN